MKIYCIRFKKTATARSVYFITCEAENAPRARELAQARIGSAGVILAVTISEV